MVAKSYQNYKQNGEPYQKNGRWYVSVTSPKGIAKEVRWYSEKEYAKMYPDAEPAVKRFKTQKQVFGFDKGYITIFRGDTYEHNDFFKLSNARYARLWGWYVVSTEELPDPIPSGIEPIQLPWEDVGNENGSLKSEDEIKTAVEALLYPPSSSQFVGKIGERLDLVLTVERVVNLDNYFGSSQMHIMHDEEGNVFVWTTSARSWAEGSQRLVRGTVKDHKVYRNECQTWLTRCSEIG